MGKIGVSGGGILVRVLLLHLVFPQVLLGTLCCVPRLLLLISNILIHFFSVETFDVFVSGSRCFGPLIAAVCTDVCSWHFHGDRQEIDLALRVPRPVSGGADRQSPEQWNRLQRKKAPGHLGQHISSNAKRTDTS